MDAWSGGDLGLVAGDGIAMGAATHQLVAVIKLCELMAADPGASAASGRYPWCRGFEAWRCSREGWTRGAERRRAVWTGVNLIFILFHTDLRFIRFDFWSPNETGGSCGQSAGRLEFMVLLYYRLSVVF